MSIIMHTEGGILKKNRNKSNMHISQISTIVLQNNNFIS